MIGRVGACHWRGAERATLLARVTRGRARKVRQVNVARREPIPVTKESAIPAVSLNKSAEATYDELLLEKKFTI